MGHPNKMREYRTNKGLTMKELSMSSGVSERYLYFIENGERTPSIRTAKKIADVLCGNIEQIFFDTVQN